MNAPVDVSFFPRAAKPLASYRPYWAKRFGTAPFLPMSREEMARLGWDSCDVILVTGDAYVDHPSFGMAVQRVEECIKSKQIIKIMGALRSIVLTKFTLTVGVVNNWGYVILGFVAVFRQFLLAFRMI